MSALLRVARNVRDLSRATAFYRALGFSVASQVRQNPALAACLNVARVRCQYLTIGGQTLELTECEPAGADYPADAMGNDLCFQHIALATDDIACAATRALQAGGFAITQGGPQQLPPEAGGVVAFKFRDPEGHPLEYLQGAGDGAGYGHSAISVSDVAQSVAFYASMGFEIGSCQVNRGPAQARLDGVPDPLVDVIALTSGGAPHVELLHYQAPAAGKRHWALNDIAADRLVIRASAGEISIRRDPDGHIVLLERA